MVQYRLTHRWHHRWKNCDFDQGIFRKVLVVKDFFHGTRALPENGERSALRYNSGTVVCTIDRNRADIHARKIGRRSMPFQRLVSWCNDSTGVTHIAKCVTVPL